MQQVLSFRWIVQKAGAEGMGIERVQSRLQWTGRHTQASVEES